MSEQQQWEYCTETADDDPDEDEASSVDYVYGDTLNDVMLEWAEVVREFEAGER